MSTEVKFGDHEPTAVVDHRNASPLGIFSRGIQVGSGRQWKFKFENGYGASVINDGYGHESGRYELAVIGPDGRISYDTPLTDDVLGFLTEAEVAEALDRIKSLRLVEEQA